MPTTKYSFPWRQSNHFTLLIDAESFYPPMLEAIDKAAHYIFLEMYLVESGQVATHFIDALHRAAARGVKIYLLFDAYGALGLNKQDRYRLGQYHNIHLIFYNPLHLNKWRQYLLRDHRKLLLVDGESAFTGGAGITDEFDKDIMKGKHWRDTVVQISGECVQDWREVFVRSWSRWATETLTLEHDPVASLPHAQCAGRVVISPIRGKREVRRSLVNHIRHAQHRVYIATAYFVASRKLRRVMRQAARRGIDVRLLVPGPRIDHPAVRHVAQRFYLRLLRHGVRIFEYQPRFLHSKVMLCDDWASIGSSNIDRWNLRWNLEANQEIQDDAFATQVETMFQHDFSHCLEITYDNWRRRNFYTRLLEWFWGIVDRQFARLYPGARDTLPDNSKRGRDDI
jgi:cardiolipin synthase